MLSKKNRFTRKVFAEFAARPDIQTAYNRLGTLKYVPGKHRFAVVTSSKHEKRAVARNLLRRRLYQWFASAKAPLSGILYASKQSYGLDRETQHSLFTGLLVYAEKSRK